MVIRHKKNTVYYLAIPMVDADTPASFLTGLTVADTAYRKDAAGAWTALAITDTFAEIGATGIYKIDLTAAELNHDKVIIKMTSAGAADSLVMLDMDTQEIDDIPTTAMRGTDSAALASVCTEPRLAELAAANLPTDIAAIPTTPMRGTDSANTTVPDAAGTASSLHGTTNGLIAALNNITAASVWAVGTRTLTSFGSLIAGIWAYASRTLTGGGGDATAANQTSMIKLLEADYSIDTTATPWELVVTQSGTATELLRKKLYQADGTNVTSADHLVGRHTNTATQ